MTDTNGSTNEQSRKRYRRKCVALITAIAVLGCGLDKYYGPIPALLGYGGSNGQIAKLQFRLREKFPVTSVAWSPDGLYIATGSTMDTRIDIWDVLRRQVIKVLHRRFPPASFHDITWSPDERYLTFCDAPGVLRVYRTSTWTEAHEFSGAPGNGGCTQSAFSADSSQLAMLGTHLLGVFSVPDWRTEKSLNLDIGWGRADFFNAISYLPNTKTVIIGGGQYVTIPYYGKKAASWNGRVWFFGSSDQIPSRSMLTYRADGRAAGPVVSLTVSPDGQFIVTGAKTGAGNQSTGFVIDSVHILEVSDGSVVGAPLDRFPPLKFGSDQGLAFSHDGQYIIVIHGGQDGSIHVLDGRTFKVVDLLTSNAFNYDVAVSGTNDDFAVGMNRQVIVWALPQRH